MSDREYFPFMDNQEALEGRDLSAIRRRVSDLAMENEILLGSDDGRLPDMPDSGELARLEGPILPELLGSMALARAEVSIGKRGSKIG